MGRDSNPAPGVGDNPPHSSGRCSPAGTTVQAGYAHGVTITAYKDNTDFTVKSPSVTWYLKKAAGIELGSGRPSHVVASSVTVKHIYEISKVKQSNPYCQYMSLESICKSIIGTANTMGIQVVKELD
ncbi:hypothetical protein AAG906_024137 [Vitis piasezkii]